MGFAARSAFGWLFCSKAVQSLMSPLEWGPCLNTISPPSSVVDFKGHLAEKCTVILSPCSGTAADRNSSLVTSTRPHSFWPHFLLQVPGFFIFLCSIVFDCRMFSGVLRSGLLSIAFPPGVLWLLRPNSYLSEEVFSFLSHIPALLQEGEPY